MGIAKSLRKAGYLEGLGTALNEIGNILEANRKQKAQEKLYNQFREAFSKWQEGYDKANLQRELKEDGRVTNIFSPENFTGISGEKPAGLNLKVNLPEDVEEGYKQGLFLPPTQTRETSPKERYDKAQTELSEFLQAIVPMALNRDVDEETLKRANVLSELAQRETERLKPKEPKYFNLGKSETAYRITDDNIEKIAEGMGEKGEYLLDKKIGEYVDKNNNQVLILQKPNGETYTKDFGKVRTAPRGGGGLTEPKPPTSEKWKEFAEKIKRLRQDSFTDASGRVVSLTEQEKKERKDDAMLSGLATLLPGAYRWYNKNIRDAYGKGWENVSHDTFLREISEGLLSGELTPQEAQDLVDFDAYREDIFGGLREQEQGLQKLEEFITDFKNEIGREPSQTEIEKAKGRYWQ